MTGRRLRWLPCVLVLLMLALVTVWSAPAAYAGEPERPVIVVGMAGVQWDDVSASTPALASLLDHGAAGNLVSRSVTPTSCPADGWLALSSGSRAAAPRTTSVGCDTVAEPSEDGAIPAWDAYQSAVADQPYGATLGTLGDTLAEAGIAAAAAGPGAAVALADKNGKLAGDYGGPAADVDALTATLPELFNDHALTVIDLGAADASDDSAHHQQVADIDARLDVVLQTAKEVVPDAVVVVASLADASATPGLQVAWIGDPQGTGTQGTGTQGTGTQGTGTQGTGTLVSSSTRQDGLAQATDLTPTVLELLGLEAPADLPGSPISAGDSATDQATLVDQADHSAAVRPTVGVLYATLVVLNLALIAVTCFWWRTREPAREIRFISGICASLAAVPAASFAANAVPWWRTSSPGVVYAGLVVGFALAVAALAHAGPWRASRWGPAVVVSAFSAAVLGVDVLGVTPLQFAAPMGISPLVGGRFYGFGNSAFVLWATAMLFLAAALAGHLRRRGHRRTAAVCVAVLGVVCVGVDGAPGLGADFGGPPATLPAFAVLALLVLGVRLTWRRSLVVLAGCMVIALSISVLDWLRPPAERSHLGRFVESVLSGDLGAVLGRKTGQNVSNLFGSELTFLAIGGTLFLVFAVARGVRRSGASELSDGGVSQQLQSLLIALGVCWGVAFLVNDSGVLLPAVGMMLAVPLLIGMRSRPADRPALRRASRPAQSVQPASSANIDAIE